jgi:hypothetical protein
MPRSDFDVITGPPAPIRPIPPAGLPAVPVPPAPKPERQSSTLEPAAPKQPQ